MAQDSQRTDITRKADTSREMLDLSGREYQALWFAVARLPWNSLVLVPADEGSSVAHIAKALAGIGDQLSVAPVTYIISHPLDYKEAIQIATGISNKGWGGEGRPLPRAGRVIIAIEPVVTEPFGVAVCQEADATVVCVEMGRSGVKAARKTLRLIGREHVVGSFLVG
jgi:hypothetical protein